MNFSAKSAEITPYTDRLVWVELEGQDNDDILKNIDDSEIVKHLGVERCVENLDHLEVLEFIDIETIKAFVRNYDQDNE